MSNFLSRRNGLVFLVVGGRAGVQMLHLTAQNVPANFYLSGGFWGQTEILRSSMAWPFFLPVTCRLCLHLPERPAAINHPLEFLDLVAQQGGFLKFKLIRGSEHFVFEFIDRLGKIHIHAGVVEDGIGFLALRFVGGEAFLHRPADTARRDVVLAVVFELTLAAVFGDGQKFFDAVGHHVGVENHFAIEMPRGAPGGLDQARLAAQKTFLVGVENRHERDFRQVQAFAEQIDADQHVEFALAQRAQNFHAFDGVNLAVG